jgi:hypothetical protein
MDFSLLIPSQRRPAMLVQTYVNYVKECALKQIDPRHLIP